MGDIIDDSFQSPTSGRMPNVICLIFRDEKKEFIRSKYEKRRYAIVTCANLEDRRQDLKQAILSRDIYALLQVYAEGIDFMDPLPEMVESQVTVSLMDSLFRFFGSSVSLTSLSRVVSISGSI